MPINEHSKEKTILKTAHGVEFDIRAHETQHLITMRLKFSSNGDTSEVIVLNTWAATQIAEILKDKLGYLIEREKETDEFTPEERAKLRKLLSNVAQ